MAWVVDKWRARRKTCGVLGANAICPRSSRLPSTFQPKLRLAPRTVLSASGSCCMAACRALDARMNSSSVGMGTGLQQCRTILQVHVPYMVMAYHQIVELAYKTIALLGLSILTLCRCKTGDSAIFRYYLYGRVLMRIRDKVMIC